MSIVLRMKFGSGKLPKKIL